MPRRFLATAEAQKARLKKASTGCPHHFCLISVLIFKVIGHFNRFPLFDIRKLKVKNKKGSNLDSLINVYLRSEEALLGISKNK